MRSAADVHPDDLPPIVATPARRRNPLALSLLALAVPLALGAAHVAVTMRDRFFNVGDVALMELATRSAAHGDQLLGPYSRFGWHHPGPALFYVYAPFLQLSGGSSRAPFLAALTLNLVCGLIVVVVARRHVGEVPAGCRCGAPVRPGPADPGPPAASVEPTGGDVPRAPRLGAAGPRGAGVGGHVSPGNGPST